MKITWSPRARKRVREYGDYISQDNVKAADKWTEGIIDKVEMLIEFPERGRLVPEDGRANIREIFYKSHRIIYSVELKQILIITIRHARQLIDLKEL